MWYHKEKHRLRGEIQHKGDARRKDRIGKFNKEFHKRYKELPTTEQKQYEDLAKEWNREGNPPEVQRVYVYLISSE